MVHWVLAASLGISTIAHGGGPTVISVSPSSRTGAGGSLSFVYSDPDGGSDITLVEVAIVSGTELSGRHACNFYAGGNRLWLRDDGDSAWLGPVTGGSQATLRNSQCAVAAASFKMSPSSDRLTVTVTVTFSMPFVGTKSVFTKATDALGQASDWTPAGRWQVTPLNPGLEVVSSSCVDSSNEATYTVLDTLEQGGRSMRRIITPSCYPRHSHYVTFEGAFLDDGRPLPMMGRTAGHFEVLLVFVDTDDNRQRLVDNAAIPDSVRAKVANGRFLEGVTGLAASYTPAAVMAGVRPEAVGAVSFGFTAVVSSSARRDLEQHDGGLGFANYDAVALIDEMGPAGLGVRRWPWARHVFDGRNGGYYLNLSPRALTQALLGHELLGRNLPTLLSEYLLGERTLVLEGGVTYDRTPLINPRTGENIEPLTRAYEGKTPVATYIGGYADVDGDGVIDCVDPEITPTADNVDGDFIPDRFDPDLRVNHRPYSWLYADRAAGPP